MTTFQVIIDSFFRMLSGVLPFSYAWISQIDEHFLHFTSKPEMDYLVTLILSLSFLVYFRYDWLGLISSFIKTVLQPKSILSPNRTLDQEIMLFLVSVSLPLILLKHWISPWIAENEILLSPIAYGIFFLINIALLRFASRWNKRIKGLNHLRLMDAFPVLMISLLSLHPAFPIALVFWLGFSLTNYHYEAVYKYSMMLLGIQSIAHLSTFVGKESLKTVLESVGYLNSIAVVVVLFSILWWMILEHLQNNLNESTFRSAQWFNALAAILSFAFFALKG